MRLSEITHLELDDVSVDNLTDDDGLGRDPADYQNDNRARDISKYFTEFIKRLAINAHKEIAHMYFVDGITSPTQIGRVVGLSSTTVASTIPKLTRRFKSYIEYLERDGKIHETTRIS